MHALLFGVGAVFPGDVVGGPGTVKFVCLGVSVGVHHPHQSGHPLGLLHHPQAPFGVAALFPIRDTGFIDFILQLPGQRTEPIHLQGERFDTQVLRVASAAVGTESEGDPNSGGRLPECALCGHPHKFLGGAVRCAVRCGARCVAPDRYYPTRGRSGGHADPGSDRAHRIGEATFFAGYRVTGGSSSSESAPLSAGCTSTTVRAALASWWDCDRGENDIPQYSQIECTSG